MLQITLNGKRKKQMSNVIRKATNKFTKGLVMDFSPENTTNELLTHALNATLLTFNGNEMSLQNDMGNARVETAYLPEGYIPVGTCEYGGIIYIVSYNPLEDKSLIGCFPSPERNISNTELGMSNALISKTGFLSFDKDGHPTGTITNTTQTVLLKHDKLNPGDKFLVCSNPSLYDEKLADLYIDKDPKHFTDNSEDPNAFELISNPVIALNIVSIEDSGKIVYLNSDIKKYTHLNTYQNDGVSYTDNYKYHILGEMAENNGSYDQASVDPDSYRNVLNSGYSVFKSKTSGKLAILAELIMIDSYSVTHSIEAKKDADGKPLLGEYDIVVHSEISPEITIANYNTAPKLQYFYLKNSQGYIQVSPSTPQPNDAHQSGELYNRYMFIDGIPNTSFGATLLTDIYSDTTLSGDLQSTGLFNFPLPNTYHGRMSEYSNPDLPENLSAMGIYTKFTEGKYHRINTKQVLNNRDYYVEKVNAKFYKFITGQNEYEKVPPEATLDMNENYYVEEIKRTYKDIERNGSYKTEKLFKIAEADPNVAFTQEIENVLIEKFRQTELHIYKEASEQEIAEHNLNELFIKTEEGYENPPDKNQNVPYYLFERKTAFVSVGYEVDLELYEGVELYYYPVGTTYIEATKEDVDMYFDYSTYPFKDEPPSYGAPFSLYIEEIETVYKLATEEQKLAWKDENIPLYSTPSYVRVLYDALPETTTDLYFITVPIDTYINTNYFIPNKTDNYIQDIAIPEEIYANEGPILLFEVANFIPSNIIDPDNYTPYDSFKLAHIKIPGQLAKANKDLLFKYDYTLVPCMNYGRLDHLSVSNTIDFSKLSNFENSQFNVWKYHIDGELIRLTFGANVYDTTEENKVDALILEFYDLWGFAGSLEITGKKSYSGVFTKILNMNTFGALSTNRILDGNRVVSTFKRNIGLYKHQTTGEFMLNNTSVKYEGSEKGWSVALDDNDCGVIYPNIVYGVKTYLRQVDKDGNHTYTQKKDMFLYTMPIYNSYYYNVDDFNAIGNPALDLILTFKLLDLSEVNPYNSALVADGYTDDDRKKVQSYLSGNCPDKDLSITKYYSYIGTSKLNLEIGLLEDYLKLNLSCDPAINNHFTCDIKLLNNEGNGTWSFEADDKQSSMKSVLNYLDDMDTSINLLGFINGSSDTYKISNNFNNYNFISSLNSSYIPIKYEFVVGHRADISSITDTAISATTVSALLHKTNGQYNYEDFNIYEEILNDKPVYLSNLMFFNGGNVETEKFGICKQMYSAEAKPTAQQECVVIDSIETAASRIATPGVINSGKPLKQMVPHIGKLSFCSALAHCIDPAEGVNIGKTSGYLMPTYVGGHYETGDKKVQIFKIDGSGSGYDNTWGIIPSDKMFKEPRYNMCLYTKKMINHYGEFISTIDCKTVSGATITLGNTLKGTTADFTLKKQIIREYVGISGKLLLEYNEKLMTTMKSIYAYNPDYDSLIVKTGKISVPNELVKFTSNVISENAKLNMDLNSFNDYIHIGGMKFADYLDSLSTYSADGSARKIVVRNEGVPIDVVSFKPNLRFCGSDQQYLVTSLTYNIVTPTDFKDELEYKSNNLIVVQHEDGNRDFIKGELNKKALYTYHKNKLIELNAENYTIDQLSGALSIIEKPPRYLETFTDINLTNVSTDNLLKGYSFNNGSDSVVLKIAPETNNVVTSLSKNSYKMYILVTDNLVQCHATLSYSSREKDRILTYTMPGLDLNRCSCKIINTLQSIKDITEILLNNLFDYNTVPKGIELVDSPVMYVDGSEYNGGGIESPDSFTLTSSKYYSNTITIFELVFWRATLRKSYRYDYTFLNKYTLINSSYPKKLGGYVNKDHKYVLNRENTNFVGTSLTVLDLEYEPNSEHRLFITPQCIYNDRSWSPTVYYRTLLVDSEKLDDADWKTNQSWTLTEPQHPEWNTNKINCLMFYTGPCFTEK